jgi:hypothetical protein
MPGVNPVKRVVATRVCGRRRRRVADAIDHAVSAAADQLHGRARDTNFATVLHTVAVAVQPDLVAQRSGLVNARIDLVPQLLDAVQFWAVGWQKVQLQPSLGQ